VLLAAVLNVWDYVPIAAASHAAFPRHVLSFFCALPCSAAVELQTREYFIAAVPEVWDYVPFGGEMCGGSKVNFSDNAKTFVEAGPDRIGSKYLKALYVEYTDATFKTRKVGASGQQAGGKRCGYHPLQG
jgi:hypothetical protein